MGYRSSVRCLIYGTKDHLEAYMTSQVLVLGSSVFRDFKDALTRYTISKDEGGELHILDLCGEGWKWYDNYDDVKSWMLFMTDSGENDLEYEFIRIGEDDGDVERITSENYEGLLYTTNPQIGEDFERGTEVPLNY